MTADTVTLEALAEGFTALESELVRLREDNARLRALVISGTAEHNVSRSDDGTHAPASTVTLPEPLTRRRVLRRAVQATAATVVASAIIGRDTQDADATHGSGEVITNYVGTHTVIAENYNGSFAILASTDTDASGNSAMHGHNSGSGAGTSGLSIYGIGVVGEGRLSTGVVGRGLVGVTGESKSEGYGAVYGLNKAVDGYGVIGDATGGRSAAILGRNNDGDAIRGQGKVGVHGVSLDGNGVVGEGVGGYGGLFKSSRAQIRLAPNGRIGKPTTGAHYVGELYLDKVGSLFICTVAGTPGIWRKVSTTTA